ncbi:preprotein translocase subunit Sec61beta [Candidatus Woesearchaeota archaeon]|nr:preprotein translocase subunit Sec61beta [Candidatus Woesearchaeota archaeon]MBW3005701.1 preprotein translocase subunit Sec61beta [Candidatus Woesearchaeota archaeon]
MADKKVQMPTSTAGLTRYFEDYRSKLEFKPGTVIILAVIVVLITIVLHIYGSSFLGL